MLFRRFAWQSQVETGSRTATHYMPTFGNFRLPIKTGTFEHTYLQLAWSLFTLNIILIDAADDSPISRHVLVAGPTNHRLSAQKQRQGQCASPSHIGQALSREPPHPSSSSL